MIALDTNLLVYAHREDSPGHDAAYARLTELAEGRALGHPMALSARVSGHRDPSRIYAPPTLLAAAVDQVEAWLESPSLTLLTESEGYWPTLRTFM